MLKNNFGLKKLGFGGARTSTPTRLASAIQDPSATNGLVSGGNWATGITSGVKGFLTGLGAMKDLQNEREYEQNMEQKYQDQLATEAADKAQAQANWQATFDQNKANADRDFALKQAIADRNYENQQRQNDPAIKQAEYDRADAVAKQAHEYKMAEIAAANEYKKYELEGKKAAEEAEKKAKAEKAAELQAESYRAAENALTDMEDIAKSGDLTKFGYTWANWTPWGGSDEHEQLRGRMTANIAAIGPLVLKRAKEAGVSGINTVGEAMMYIGLPENPTSEQLAGALPRIRDFLGMAKTEQQHKQQSISDLW